MLDGITCVIVLLSALIGARKGLGDTVLRLLGLVGGLALAMLYGKDVSEYLLKTPFRDTVYKRVFEIIRPEQDNYSKSLPGFIGEVADNAADKVDRALYKQAVSDVMKLSEFVEDFTDGEICKLIMMKARPEDFPNVDPDYVNAKLAYYWEAADLAEDVHCRYEEEPCEYFSD